MNVLTNASTQRSICFLLEGNPDVSGNKVAAYRVRP